MFKNKGDETERRYTRDFDLAVLFCLSVCLSVCLSERVDTLPLKSVQKLKIYKLCICSRLSWLLSVQEYPFSCIERHLEPIATSYLKKWCHISRCANTSCLYLPSTNLGLNMPSISSLYKSLQIGRYYRVLSSSDNRVQCLFQFFQFSGKHLAEVVVSFLTV